MVHSACFVVQLRITTAYVYSKVECDVQLVSRLMVLMTLVQVNSSSSYDRSAFALMERV